MVLASDEAEPSFSRRNSKTMADQLSSAHRETVEKVVRMSPSFPVSPRHVLLLANDKISSLLAGTVLREHASGVLQPRPRLGSTATSPCASRGARLSLHVPEVMLSHAEDPGRSTPSSTREAKTASLGRRWIGSPKEL